MKFRLAGIISSLLLLTNCRSIPQKKLSQAPLEKVIYEVKNDSLSIKFNNPLDCPLRLSVISTDQIIQERLDLNFPVTIPPKNDTLLRYWTDKTKDEIPLKFSVTIGDAKDSTHKKDINLPFPKGSKYNIIQGYNGGYSHTSEYSKYAIDFNLKVGDTVCAAADGFVVGVIEGYSECGSSKKWRDYANYITLFHPEMNIYTQYVHLMLNGSFVEVGDAVKAEQAIGLSGKTGYTDMEHLHFNVLKANNSSMEATPINFKEGYKGNDLQKGNWVEK